MRARAAVSAVFFVNAVLYANLVPRLPDVKDALDLSNAALGTAIAAMPVGALLAGLFAPAVIQRAGSARVAAFGLVGLAVAVVGVPLSGSWAAFAAVMLLLGALDAVVDVAQNAHGFRVQRLYRRSVVNAFHGLWSVGAVAGGLLGSAAAGLGVPLLWHLVASAVVFSLVAVVAYRSMLAGPEDAEREPAPADAAPRDPMPLAYRDQPTSDQPTSDQPTHDQPTGDLGPPAVRDADPELDPDAGPGLDPAAAAQEAARRQVRRHAVLVLAALGALAACGAFVEDAGASWSALYLRTELGAGAATAGLGFVALQVAMTAGRLTGDRVVDRLGQRRVALGGGVLITGGTGLALAFPSVASTLAGFALAGLGVATLVPAAMHAADELPGLRHGVGLTVVSWLLRVGFLVSPAVVGVVSDATSLRVALLGVVLAGVGVLVLGRVLHDGPAAHDPHDPHDADGLDPAAPGSTAGRLGPACTRARRPARRH